MGEPGRKVGNFFARLLVEKHWQIVELERRSRVPRATIYRHLKGETFPTVQMRSKYADGLGFGSVDEFDKAWDSEPSQPSRILSELLKGTGIQPSGNPGELDNNVGRIPANPLPIPEWSAEIACGHWIDCSTAALDPDTQMAIIRAGRFRVRVMGDSMLPKYKPLRIAKQMVARWAIVETIVVAPWEEE